MYIASMSMEPGIQIGPYFIDREIGRGGMGEVVEVFAAPNLAVEASYDISPDETRMVAIQLDDDAIATELRVVTNFFDIIRAACDPAQR